MNVHFNPQSGQEFDALEPIVLFMWRLLLYYTALRKVTPHHSTGARFVAQSKVKRLMSQITTRTGTGASRTSVLLRNGRAVVKRSVSVSFLARNWRTPTLIPVEGDDEVVAEGE